MGNKAVFLDRDGTINADKNYLYRAEDFEFLPGAVEALRMLQSHGFLLIIITNQSGIARGYYTENDFLSLTEWMLERLKESGVNIAKVYYCPHLPDAKIPEYRKICDCRKPETGLFEEAAREFDVDMAKSFAVGDKMRDCSVCEKTECRGFIIGGNSVSPKIRNVSSLLEAAKIITGSER